jgi:hypothetical protein
MLRLLYKLVLDGGKVISCSKQEDTYVILVEPAAHLGTNDLRTRYGRGYGPFNIPLVPDLVEYYGKFYDQL